DTFVFPLVFCTFAVKFSIMQKIILIAGLLVLAACKTKDEKFCQCMQVSKQLNEATQYGIYNGADKAMDDKIIAIREEKNQSCADYEMMAGPELLEKKAACNLEE